MELYALTILAPEKSSAGFSRDSLRIEGATGDVLRKKLFVEFTIFTGKHLCWSFCFIKFYFILFLFYSF